MIENFSLDLTKNKEFKMRKTLYKVESGSKMYGTTTPESDTDYTSVFLPTSYDLLSLQSCEFIDMSSKSAKEYRRNTSQDVDNQAHSISRYLHLVLRANPNLTEMLFCKNPIIEDERFTELKNNYQKLLSKNCYNSFTGFAISQKKKLEYKSKRFLQLGKAIEYLDKMYTKDQLVDTKTSMNDEVSNWLNENLTEYKGKKNNGESFHFGLPVKVIYEKINNEYENYGWRCHTSSFEKLGYDTKFASHAIRLLIESEQLLLNGYLEFPFSGQNYLDIMSVRKGQVSIEEFYKLCTMYEDKNRIALEKTKLPETPDFKWSNNWLTNLLKTAIIKGEI